VEQAITPQTKAIIAVHLYGNLCDMDRLIAIGEEHGIPVIEDAAEAVGSIFHGRPAGSMGTFGTFSFHGTKTLTTGEGGMFVTNDPELYEHVLTLSNHGRVRGQVKQFWPELVGFKYKMSNIQAAIGCAQLERVGSLVERKREIFESYMERLNDLDVMMNPEPPEIVNGYWMPNVVFPPDSKIVCDELLKKFADKNIDARVFFWPLSSLPTFTPQPEHVIAYSLPSRAINLPSYHELTESDIDRVTDVIRLLCKKNMA
jgi:perosamine synthetase